MRRSTRAAASRPAVPPGVLLRHGTPLARRNVIYFCSGAYTAAYVLMQELRLRAARTPCARAQVWTLRERLLKLGARVLVSVRRVVVHLPTSFPFLSASRKVALALGALSG